MTLLGYCLNVHPGERLSELCEVLRGPAARVRAGWRGEQPLPVGLWLPAAAVAELQAPGALTQLREALDEARLVAFTVNAFPYGRFHAARVSARSTAPPGWSRAPRAAPSPRPRSWRRCSPTATAARSPRSR
ncbi:MAG: hypothetical protein R3F62_09240 [Planctomycetota bacterium]